MSARRLPRSRCRCAGAMLTLASVALLGACSSSEDAASSADSIAAEAAAGADASSDTVGAGGATDAAATSDSGVPGDGVTPVAKGDAIPAPPDAAPTDVGGGTCLVDVTGDETASWTGGGGTTALNTDYWLTPDQKQAYGDAFYFVVNCQGANGFLGFLAGATAEQATIPYGPQDYTLAAADPTAVGDQPIGVAVTIDGSDASYGLTQPGTLSITRFDESGIAGTFSFTATDLLAGDTAPARSITVTGSFDFDNPT
jgi:hypothetical protein